MYEPTEFDIAEKYSILIKGLLLTSFYATGLPIGLIFELICLITTYWADKVDLRRYY